MICSVQDEPLGDSREKQPSFGAQILLCVEAHSKATNGIVIPAIVDAALVVEAFASGTLSIYGIQCQGDSFDPHDAVPLNTVGGRASGTVAKNRRRRCCLCIVGARRRSGRQEGTSRAVASTETVAHVGEHDR